MVGKSRPEADGGRCRKHPKHRQPTGVCPFCLKERLSHLSSSSLPSVMGCGSSSSSSASSSPYYSSDGSELSSVDVSPPCHDVKRARLSLLMRQESTVVVLDAKERLGKSRSAIFAVRRRQKEKKEMEEGKKEKRNFWAKLLNGTRGPGGKKDQAGCSLAHSKTLEEKPAPKWVLF